MQFHAPSDSELASIMLQGGYEFCERAIQKWRDPEYYNTTELERALHIQRWQYAQYRCWQLVQHLRGDLSNVPERTERDVKYAIEHYS